jgi:hypothetical protein
MSQTQSPRRAPSATYDEPRTTNAYKYRTFEFSKIEAGIQREGSLADRVADFSTDFWPLHVAMRFSRLRVPGRSSR